MNQLQNFIAYLNEQADNKSIYVWGAQGQQGNQITEAWIKRRETSEKNASRAIRLWKQRISQGYGGVLRAFDCSGLGVYWLLREGVISSDMTANGLRGKCTVIQKSHLKPGDWVFRVNSAGRAYHIGYVVDMACSVVEAKSRDDGVVKRALNASGKYYWNAFGRPQYFAGEIEAQAPAWAVARLLKRTSPMLRGEDVRGLQQALIDAGHSPGTVDGIFGQSTERAVKSYQKAAKLTADGKAGKNTVRALGGVWLG